MLFLINFIFAATAYAEKIESLRPIVTQVNPGKVVMLFLKINDELSNFKKKVEENRYADFGSTEEEREGAKKIVEKVLCAFNHLIVEFESNPIDKSKWESSFEEFEREIASFNNQNVLNKMFAKVIISEYFGFLANLMISGEDVQESSEENIHDIISANSPIQCDQ